MKLIVKLMAGMLIGLLLGAFAPDSVIRFLVTLKVLFAQLLDYIIPLLIVFFIASGIAHLDHRAGRLLGMTVGIAYISTLCAGFLAVFTAIQLLPTFIHDVNFTPFTPVAITPFFTFSFPPLLSVMTALVTAFIWGVGIARTESRTLHACVDEGKNCVEWFLQRLIIPLLPLYIASVFAEMAQQGETLHTLKTLGVVLCMAIALHWIWLTVLYGFAGIVTRRSPWKALKTMFPAYVTAAGTMSSAATIPVTLAQTLRNRVHPDIANFVIPLCATIHIAGSMITLTTGAIAVIILTTGTVPTLLSLVPFILMLGVTMVAAPGVPGGGVMAALGLFTSMLGFSESAVALMISLYLAQDSFGTACNVTGDGALAMILNKACAPQAHLTHGVPIIDEGEIAE